MLGLFIESQEEVVDFSQLHVIGRLGGSSPTANLADDRHFQAEYHHYLEGDTGYEQDNEDWPFHIPTVYICNARVILISLMTYLPVR